MTNFTIRNDVPVPGDKTKICSNCGKDKPITKFSLKRGKKSDERKNFCTTCENKRKKASNLKLTTDQLESLLELRCSVCNSNDSRYVDIDENNRPNGVLCKPCHDFFKNIGIQPGDVQKALDYALIRRDFPFWHKEMLKQKQIEIEPEAPLLDWIENARQ